MPVVGAGAAAEEQGRARPPGLPRGGPSAADLAELRQCPAQLVAARYSRTVTSSALPVARGWLSPEPVHALRGICGSARPCGVTVRGTVVRKARPSSTSRRVGDAHRHRTDLEVAAHVGADLVTL